MESKSAFSRRQFMELLGVSAAGFGLVSMAGCGGGDDAKKDEGADAPAGGGGVLNGEVVVSLPPPLRWGGKFW